jgi:hypothetical protein
MPSSENCGIHVLDHALDQDRAPTDEHVLDLRDEHVLDLDHDHARPRNSPDIGSDLDTDHDHNPDPGHDADRSHSCSCPVSRIAAFNNFSSISTKPETPTTILTKLEAQAATTSGLANQCPAEKTTTATCLACATSTTKPVALRRATRTKPHHVQL